MLDYVREEDQEANKMLDDAVKVPNQVYQNIKQLKFLYQNYPDKNGIYVKDRTFIGGIGTGKTTVMATNQYRKVLAMPRSFGYLMGCNYKQIVSNLLPSMIAAWGRMGLEEGIDYVIGKAPPKTWPRPILGNKNFEHVISWSNGTGYGLLAADRKDLNRGSSFQHGDMDEAALIKEDIYNNIVVGRIRGERRRFQHSPFYEMETKFTSMPALASGMWVYNNKELQRIDPQKYFYLESTTFDNKEVLGENYLNRLKEKLDEFTYNREVLNKAYSKSTNGFYANLDEDRHLCAYSIIYKETNIKSIFDTTFKDNDTDSLGELHLSVDTSVNFNSCTVYQYDKAMHMEKLVNNFYVMKPQLLDDMIDKFIEYYKYHLVKRVYLWGDRNNNKTEANNSQTLFEQMAKRLRSKGWTVNTMYFGADNPKHKIKHQFMNDVLKEEDHQWPRLRISKEKALETYYSMNSAESIGDYQKDKRDEKRLLNSSMRYMATDLSDTVDYYLFNKWFLGYKDKQVRVKDFYNI